MRLWSLHPQYLDSQGLVALWREALLAQAVLAGKTKGYKHHPQLKRFRLAANPSAAMKRYLYFIYQEAKLRGYDFDRRKISGPVSRARLRVTAGQLRHELAHLKKKLRGRDIKKSKEISKIKAPRPHPMFSVVAGGIEDWEKRN